MKFLKSDAREFIKSAHRFSGKLSQNLEKLEIKVHAAMSSVPLSKKLDFYESLLQLHSAKSGAISNTITEIHNNGRRKETSTTSDTGEAKEGRKVCTG